jgi:hypothetical protein
VNAIQPMSDVVSLFWCLLAIRMGLRGNRATGVAFAIAVLVRPTNVLLVPALVWIVARDPLPVARGTGHGLRATIWLGITGLPFAIALLVLQHVLYGSALRSGYGGVGELIALAYFPLSFPNFAKWLLLLLPIPFPLGLIGKRLLIAAWFLPFFAFYSFYSEHAGWGVVRFLLPGVPALILGALLWISRVKLAYALAAVMVIVPAWQARRLHVFATKQEEQIYRNTVRWAGPQLPRDSLVIAGVLSGAFLYHGDRYTVNWVPLDTDRFQRMRAYAGVANLQWYAVISDVEMKRDAFASRYPGNWVVVSRYRDITLYRLYD